MKTLYLEIMPQQGDDWETLKQTQYRKRTLESYRTLARKMCQEGTYQAHVYVWTDQPEAGGEFYLVQEFYYNDGTMKKQF